VDRQQAVGLPGHGWAHRARNWPRTGRHHDRVRPSWSRRPLTLQWILDPTVCACRPRCGRPELLHVAGTWMPVSGESWNAAVPLGQGVLHTGKGPAFYRALQGHGHGFGCNMDMFGQLGPRADCSSSPKPSRTRCCIGRRRRGPGAPHVAAEPSFGRLAYTARP